MSALGVESAYFPGSIVFSWGGVPQQSLPYDLWLPSKHLSCHFFVG